MFNTIDSVIKDFTKARDKLLALAGQHEARASEEQYLIDRAVSKKKLHEGESARAAKLAANISKLID